MQTYSLQLQTLLTQFQTRYPQGVVISELATFYDQQYVIRALVQIGGMTIATGLASGTDVEQTEDRAKIRALEALPQPSALTNTFSSATSTYSPLPQPSPLTTAAVSPPAPSNPAPSPSEEPIPKLSDLPLVPASQLLAKKRDIRQPMASLPTVEAYLPDSPEQSDEPDVTFMDDTEFAIPPDLDEATTEDDKPSSTSQRGNRRKSEVPKSKASDSVEVTPVDDTMVQEARLQTDVELRRLGWTPDQGRKYLQETYGKRSRLHLTDEELFSFLHYLRSLPSPIDSPF